METRFCSLIDVKPLLNIEDGWNGSDSIIRSYIEQSSSLIRLYTRRRWDYGVYNEFASSSDIDIAIRQGSNVFSIPLTEKPVDAAQPITVRFSNAGRFNDASDVDPQAYELDTRRNRLVFYPSLMRSNQRNIRITYTAGYKEIENDPPNVNYEAGVLNVPTNIKMACIAQTAWFVRRFYNNVTGTSRKDSQERREEARITAAGLIGDALALLKTETRLFMGSNG